MTEYNFDYDSLEDRIHDLEKEASKIRSLEDEVDRLKRELIETDNILYEILNRLDSMDQTEYTLKNFTLGDS